MPRVLLLSIIPLLAQLATAAQPPVAKIVVIQPQPDQQLTGCVEVRLKTKLQEGASEPQMVYVGLGGAPWTELRRSCDGWTATYIVSCLVAAAGRLSRPLLPNVWQVGLVLCHGPKGQKGSQ